MKKKIDVASLFIIGGLMIEVVGFTGSIIVKAMYDRINKEEK